MARPREFDRDKAVQKAMELFWRRGYEATSVQELGHSLGLNPGSLYNSFKDKHSLFLEALQCYQEREYQVACSLFDTPTAGRAALERFFVLVVEHDSADPDHKGCLMVNAAAELADHDPEVRARAAASRVQMIGLFRGAIIAGQRAGEIDANRDPDALAAFLVNSLFGLRLTAKLEPDRAILLTIARATLHALD